MLKRYRLHTSSTKKASLPSELKLAKATQDILAKQTEIKDVVPLQLKDRRGFIREIEEIIHRGFTLRNDNDLDDLHVTLFLLYEEIFKPIESSTDMQFHPGLIWLRNKIEEPWITFETNNIPSPPQDLDTENFTETFNNWWSNHHYMKHPFHTYVKSKASRLQLEDLFMTESVCASRFADMVALAIPGIPRIDSVVSEVMENLTDELGPIEGEPSHKQLYAQLLEYLQVDIPSHPLNILLPFGWRAIRGLNLFMHNAIHRRNYYKMMGAIGAGELTFPFFCHNVLEGAKRNNIIDKQALMYHSQHSTLDVQHGENWLKRVLVPLLNMGPTVGQDALLGLELQLTVTTEYYDALYESWQHKE